MIISLNLGIETVTKIPGANPGHRAGRVDLQHRTLRGRPRILHRGVHQRLIPTPPTESQEEIEMDPDQVVRIHRDPEHHQWIVTIDAKDQRMRGTTNSINRGRRIQTRYLAFVASGLTFMIKGGLKRFLPLQKDGPDLARHFLGQARVSMIDSLHPTLKISPPPIPAATTHPIVSSPHLPPPYLHSQLYGHQLSSPLPIHLKR